MEGDIDLDAKSKMVENLLKKRRQLVDARDFKNERRVLLLLKSELDDLKTANIKEIKNNISYTTGKKYGKTTITVSGLLKLVNQDLDKMTRYVGDEKDHPATKMIPTTKAPLQIPTEAVKGGNRRLMVRTRSLAITPEDYIRSLSLEDLKSAPPSIRNNPAYKSLIDERIKKLEVKEQAKEKLTIEKELKDQRRIEYSKQELYDDDMKDWHVPSSALSFNDFDHFNPIMMRQFNYADYNNPAQQYRNMLEKDTLKRATKIKVIDDEPYQSTSESVGNRLTSKTKKSLAKPKRKLEDVRQLVEPVKGLEVQNRGESGLTSSELYELLGGVRDPNSDSIIRMMQNKY
jgi:hypothetical protein